jgi:3-oxoadipate enol-lactonase
MTLAHDLDGDGPTVVLLHSSVCDRRMWDPQVTLLTEAGFGVLRPDFHGFGESSMPTAVYDETEDVRELLDSRGIDRAIVVGSSMGGRVAQEFASRWPSRVAGLLLLCSATRLLEPTDDVRAFSAEEDALLEAGDVDGAVALNVRTWVGPMATAETREFVAAMQRRAFEVQLAGGDVAAQRADFDLGAVTAPTLVVSGAHDLDYFHQVAALLTEMIHGAELRELDWAGHLPSLEDPPRFNPLLLEFVRDVSTGSGVSVG